ncbi:MAG: hypothetical protein R3B45_04130 [Bdellovibrionota bacterium]
MKCLKICVDRVEAESIIHNLKKIGIVALIRSNENEKSMSNEIQLMVDDEEYEDALEKIHS